MLENLADVSTPLVADACIRSSVPLRVAPPGIAAVIPGHPIAGRVLPARHYGSVDVFLEAFSSAGPGDVLVVDNGGRAKPCASRRPSMVIWRGGQPNRPTPSGSTSGESAEPSRNRQAPAGKAPPSARPAAPVAARLQPAYTYTATRSMQRTDLPRVARSREHGGQGHSPGRFSRRAPRRTD